MIEGPPADPPAPPHEVRPVFATVTILFSDIRGFTEYTDQYGDEAAVRMLHKHNGIVEAQLARYGGQVVKRQGDSFMVSFEAARTAVTSAVAIQRKLDESRSRGQGVTIQVGIGINLGEPVREGADYFGGAVNLASRICAAAGPGQILVSQTLRNVVAKMEGTSFIDIGPQPIKGFSEPQRLFLVDWSSATQIAAPLVIVDAPLPAESKDPIHTSKATVISSLTTSSLPSATTARARQPVGGQAPPRRRLKPRLLPLAVLVLAMLVISGVLGAIALARGNSNKATNSSPVSKATNLQALPSRYAGSWTGSGHAFSPAVDFAITMSLRAGQVGQLVGEIDRPTLGCKQGLILDKATTQSITLTEQGATCWVGGQRSAYAGSKIVASLGGAALDWKEFWDPLASSASAVATLAQGSSGAIPGTSNLIAIPNAYAGTWKGSGHAFSPAVDFAITMSLRAGQVGQLVGEIDRPTLGCKQGLILDKATTQSITLTEQGATCWVGGQRSAYAGSKIVASLGGAALDWKEFWDPLASSASAVAMLSIG